jgi:uncharacterized damage-inducible protein DinB
MKSTPFDTSWNELERCTTFYRNLLNTQPLQSLQAKPAPTQWSMLEVLEHLVGAEEAVLQYLKHKQYTPLRSRGYLPGILRSLMLSLALRSPLKFKAPPVLQNLTTNKTAPKILLQRWDSLRAEFKTYLEKVPSSVTYKPLFRHPRAGVLTLPQTIVFMAEHLRHHRRQVLNLMEQKKST